jgi:hypothetical protein
MSGPSSLGALDFLFGREVNFLTNRTLPSTSFVPFRPQQLTDGTADWLYSQNKQKHD